MASQDTYSSNTVLMLSSMKHKTDVIVATQKKDYGNVNPLNS